MQLFPSEVKRTITQNHKASHVLLYESTIWTLVSFYQDCCWNWVGLVFVKQKFALLFVMDFTQASSCFLRFLRVGAGELQPSRFVQSILVGKKILSRNHRPSSHRKQELFFLFCMQIHRKSFYVGCKLFEHSHLQHCLPLFAWCLLSGAAQPV